MDPRHFADPTRIDPAGENRFPCHRPWWQTKQFGIGRGRRRTLRQVNEYAECTVCLRACRYSGTDIRQLCDRRFGYIEDDKHLTHNSVPPKMSVTSPERPFSYSMSGRHPMPSVAPAARVAFVVEAISGLQRLQREMTRMSQRDENYENKKRALQAAIQELRMMIPANVQRAGRSLRRVALPSA